MSQRDSTFDPASDEQRLLEALEQFQLAIRASRATRTRADAAFEARRTTLEPSSSDRVLVTAAAASGWRPRAVAAMAVVIAATAAVVMWWVPSAPAPPVAVATPAPSAVRSPEPAVMTPPVAEPHALRVDLTTTRRVWLRVAVDGRIAIEREVAAGEQLPFGADRTIVVRAGDGGAVTVRAGGVDQGAIGRDGLPITRAFAALPR